jgi:prolyl-tRNA editing enzyme YbaK/EbsC (Cys-tRNA(Pro) deacylase)
MEVWVDRSLGRSEAIVFNAGTHKDALRIKCSGFANFVRPIVADFCEARAV